jgi:hypothetical protein
VKRRLTNLEVQANRWRWKHVTNHEISELRGMTPTVRWRQFVKLLTWAREHGWTDYSEEEISEVRDRWNRLRQAYAKAAKLDKLTP